jgi:hypothetical protein
MLTSGVIYEKNETLEEIILLKTDEPIYSLGISS